MDWQLHKGLGFLTIYLGPTLMTILGWLVLRKIIRISKVHRITSIADFIASRYGKSPVLGGAVSPAIPPVSWPVLLAALVFLGVGPSVLAYRCWGMGVAAVGPAMAAFFANLTPLFAALLSLLLLGEPPRPFHALAFACIVGGIWLSSRK